jgi:hypothetical protein
MIAAAARNRRIRRPAASGEIVVTAAASGTGTVTVETRGGAQFVRVPQTVTFQGVSRTRFSLRPVPASLARRLLTRGDGTIIIPAD